jgi:alcohol dehydrogenase
MRAAVLENVGSPLVLKHLPDPTPAAGDVVLKVLAVPVLNYAKEVFSGERQYPNLFPLVPGPAPSRPTAN